MSSEELAYQVVFCSVGPFITSLWLAGDWGLTTTIFLIGQFLIRLPVFGQDTNLGWLVFNDLTAFWNYMMLGYLIVGCAAAGTIARLVLKVPNIVNIRKLVYSQGDRNQSKFLQVNNGTAFLMLFFGLLAIAGTLVFHDIFIPANMMQLLAVIATPFIIAALYLVVFFTMKCGFNNREGTALWGYDKKSNERWVRGQQVPDPNWSVMTRALLSVAAHHIILTVAIDLAIIFSKDFLTTFIVAAAGTGGLLLIDIIIYAFYLRSVDDYAPFYNDWVHDISKDVHIENDFDLDGVNDDEEVSVFNSRAVPMKPFSAPAAPKISRPTRNFLGIKKGMLSASNRL